MHFTQQFTGKKKSVMTQVETNSRVMATQWSDKDAKEANDKHSRSFLVSQAIRINIKK